MFEPQEQHEQSTGTSVPPFRLDVQLHELLTRPAPPKPPSVSLTGHFQKLPDPVFPQRPELLEGQDKEFLPQNGRRHWTPAQILHAMRGWMFPYFKSRVLPGDFHPIVTYLFTEWKCNLDCHYCWAFENSVKGMTEEVARRSLDWMHSTTCRVLALMGGEPLLRPDFVHKVIHYAARKGFWIHLPTNGRLMRPDVIDRLADAGVSVVNLAIGAVDLKPGLPKALVPIRPYFDYLFCSPDLVVGAGRVRVLPHILDIQRMCNHSCPHFVPEQPLQEL
jgi:hypothetical protein